MILLDIQTSYIPWQMLIAFASFSVALASLMIGVFGRWSAKRSKRLERIENKLEDLNDSHIDISRRVTSLEDAHKDESKGVRDRLDKIMDLFLNFKK